MKLNVWSNSDGLHLLRPAKPSSLTEIDFDPDAACDQCGERVISISTAGPSTCTWCISGTNRPKMLRYQELEIIHRLRQQSDENLALRSDQRRMIANRCTEKDLRDHFTTLGYFGQSMKFLQLELAAIERPGWVQIFRFHVQAKNREGGWEELFGNCRIDERINTFEVQLFEREEEQDRALRLDAKDMITGERPPRHWVQTALLLLFLVAAGAALVGMILSPPKSGSMPGDSNGVRQMKRERQKPHFASSEDLTVTGKDGTGSDQKSARVLLVSRASGRWLCRFRVQHLNARPRGVRLAGNLSRQPTGSGRLMPGRQPPFAGRSRNSS